MGMVSRIVSLWGRVATRLYPISGKRSDDVDSRSNCLPPDDCDALSQGPSSAQVDFDELDPKSISSRADVIYETGLSPEAFFEQLIEAQGGSLRQQAFTDHVDWSASLVSRVLTDMEQEGRIIRVKVGHANIVYTPGNVPDVVASSTDLKEDRESDGR